MRRKRCPALDRLVLSLLRRLCSTGQRINRRLVVLWYPIHKRTTEHKRQRLRCEMVRARWRCATDAPFSFWVHRLVLPVRPDLDEVQDL